jgi:hypothetical protein
MAANGVWFVWFLGEINIEAMCSHENSVAMFDMILLLMYLYTTVGINRKEKSAADDSERSKSVKSDGDRSYEWVKKTLETLRMNSGCRAQTNGHRWNGAYKSDVTNHLSHLSHQGYGLANGKSYFLCVKVFCSSACYKCGTLLNLIRSLLWEL